MKSFIEKHASSLSDRSGLDMIYRELDRQEKDIEDTFLFQKEQVQKLAKDIRKTGKILLLGMGASHLVNEIFALQLRRFKFDALAMTASEFIYDPVPFGGKTVILTSQSGESIETVKCIRILKNHPFFCVTLTKDSTIGNAGTAIVCAGGPELAFAGTRSVTLSLAAFADVCAELGQIDIRDILPAVRYQRHDDTCLKQAVSVLTEKKTVIATGRSLFAPAAHLFALGSEELSSFSMIYEETGTLRHGPLETVNSETVIVIFRQSGSPGELCCSFNEVQKKTGCALIVFDASGLEPLKNAVTIPCLIGDDIIAVLGLMTGFQELMITFACEKNPRAGLPRIGGKVTRTE